MSYPIQQVRQLPTYGGSLKNWVDRVEGNEYTCTCGETFAIGRGGSEIYAYIRYPDGVSERVRAAIQDLKGDDRNLGVSESTAAESLNDAENNRASAFFTCPNCKYQFGHHREDYYGGY